MKSFRQLTFFILFGLLSACSSTPDKSSLQELDPVAIPDANTQGLSENNQLDGAELAEVLPYQDNYGVQGPIAEPGEPLSIRVFHFDFDSSQVRPADYEAINAHADYLLANPGSRISL